MLFRSNKASNVPLIICDPFAERNLGVFEELTLEEAKLQYPDLYARKCTRQPDDAPTGGETLRQFDMRVTAALENLQLTYPESKILLVCHLGVARIITDIIKD